MLLIVLPSTLLMAQRLDRQAITLENLFTLTLVLRAIFASYQAVVNTIRALSEQPVHSLLSIPFVQ